jgi:hypothetical protein
MSNEIIFIAVGVLILGWFIYEVVVHVNKSRKKKGSLNDAIREYFKD